MFAKHFRSKESRKKGKEISLIVEDAHGQNRCVVKLPKRLLVQHSPVFKRMADNGDFKRSREVKLQEITATGLQKIAEYIGKDSVYFQNHYEAIDTLKAAYIYQIQVMHGLCSDFLITIIDSVNVCEIYEFASNFSFHSLEYHCLKFIDEHSEAVLNSPGFLTLKKATVLDIVRRHTLNVRYETLVFRRILTWGLNDCLRRGIDAEQMDGFVASVKSLLARVRFLTMSREEMLEPDVDKFYKLIHSSEDSSNKRKSLLSLESRSRSSTVDSLNLQPRSYQREYIHDLELFISDDHPLKNGESFCLRVEVLKGKLFLTAITLAFDTFITTKNTACLYVTVSATNVQSTDQKCARGTFLNSSEEAELTFPSPLVARESEVVEIALNVKRAENICPMMLKSDIQIAMPETKDVAMKITPTIMTGENMRTLFQKIKYFF